jgi:hypothetical protein
MFVKGQKVKTVTGKVFIVSKQIDCMVYVEGSSMWYHPTKLFAL